MSVVSGITIICSVVEDEESIIDVPVLFTRCNDWMEHRGRGRPLEAVHHIYGGGKDPQCFVAGAGLNMFPEDEFAEFFQSLPWECPENALLIIQPEEGPTRVWRCDHKTRPA